ncbi:DUF4352 domain-containing protein [Fusibacter bizertensis]|uniref:DUF4352 domain-containing protein n=1 Tax=Fusibacter bizertensis TaxID=1488331 RepID=A0ABT6N9U5_9FIRM|nr:DUF4352 domain-containing protein [Fusibacter bizertensis]MDH8677180.1 DUF4352 domain-containing protein [Fusibacter bizertensis]
MKKLIIIILTLLLAGCSSAKISTESESSNDFKELPNHLVETSNENTKAIGEILSFDTYQFQVLKIYQTDKKIKSEQGNASIYIAEVMYKNISEEKVFISASDILVKNKPLTIWEFSPYSESPTGMDTPGYLVPHGTVKRLWSFAIYDSEEKIISIIDEKHGEINISYDIDCTKKMTSFTPLSPDEKMLYEAQFNGSQVANSDALELIIQESSTLEYINPLEKTISLVSVDIEKKVLAEDLKYIFYLKTEDGFLIPESLESPFSNYINVSILGCPTKQKLFFNNDDILKRTDLSLSVYSQEFGQKPENLLYDIKLDGSYYQGDLKSDFIIDPSLVKNTVMIGDVKVSLETVYDRLSSKDSNPHEDNVFRIAKFNLENVKGEKIKFSPTFFNLVSKEGISYQIGNVDGLDEDIFDLFDLNLNLGSKYTSYIYAEVPKDEELYLIYESEYNEISRVLFDFSKPDEVLE